MQRPDRGFTAAQAQIRSLKDTGKGRFDGVDGSKSSRKSGIATCFLSHTALTERGFFNETAPSFICSLSTQFIPGLVPFTCSQVTDGDGKERRNGASV